mgnify:CR=1 FL=1
MDVIAIKGLEKVFGDRQVLSNISFSVGQGKICGFIGPNGAGKTTTIRVLLNLIKPTNGNCQILGMDLSDNSYLKEVGAMIEGPAFYPNLSGLSNLKVLAALGGIDSKRADELIKLVGLGDRAKSKFKSYSLGMKQRLGIAAALLPDPKILILDEPTNGLDPNGIKEMRELIKSLSAQDKTILVSSHLLSELEAICDSIVMIKDGKIILDKEINQISNVSSADLILFPEYAIDVRRLFHILEKAGVRAEINNGAVAVAGSDYSGAELNRLAQSAGVTLKLITSAQNTLEARFFELVANG